MDVIAARVAEEVHVINRNRNGELEKFILECTPLDETEGRECLSCGKVDKLEAVGGSFGSGVFAPDGREEILEEFGWKCGVCGGIDDTYGVRVRCFSCGEIRTVFSVADAEDGCATCAEKEATKRLGNLLTGAL